MRQVVSRLPTFAVAALASALGVALALLIALIPAKASSCFAVRDFDKRQACLAEERRSPEGCTSIRDWDQRELCRQRAGRRSPESIRQRLDSPWN